jgi:DNA-binding SARP family transcriptional activator
MAERRVRGPAPSRTDHDLAAAMFAARCEYAEMLLEAGRPGEALAAARASVAEEPYREDGWRLLMRITALTGGGAAVVPVYVDCMRCLETVGLEPSGATVALFAELRDPVSDPGGGISRQAA